MVKANKVKSGLRQKADKAKPFICKYLIVVLENPSDDKNIGTVIRNVNALGAEKVYVVDEARKLPANWESMRENRTLSSTSASAVKWTFVKRFNDSESCVAHLEKNGFSSIVTSPHIKGRINTRLEYGNFTKYKKLAVWFGNESRGISDFAVKHSEECINIPIHGIIESFNLATSTGIVLYEITKQRRLFQFELRARSRKKA
jgi:tRNA (guanosine-2'-O-)-methyltransferase